jgi:HYR domain
MTFPLRSLRAVVCVFALAVVLPSEAFAQKVLLLAAEPAGAEGVQQRLKDTNRFATVDLIRVDEPGSTPSLATLLQYDAVLTWTDAPYDAPDALGDVLSQYVDAGHGVVEAAFSLFNDPTLNLGGRWRTLSYDAFTYGDMSGFAGLTLAAVQPQHAILAGVAGLNGDANLGHVGLTVVNGELIAEWSSHEPLVASRVGPQGGRIIGLNIYPVFASDADGTQLIANALAFATTPADATNHAPTANAGADQTLEAVGPTGAAFTVHGLASDPDGDALTIAWTGTGLVGNQPSFSGTLLPPVGVKSVSYTLTLTVSDNHGGLVSDDVVVTVTDTKGPVLSNVPGPVLSAQATSASGAPVSYGPIAAVDAVDGARPVTCSKSGVFPIGDTVVTCKSTDSRGNSASASFTVRVTDVTTPGLMWGAGTVRSGDFRYDIEFAVGERSFHEGALLGLQVKDERNSRRAADRFAARTTNFVAFFNDPAVHPRSSRIDTVLFSGLGEWNGRGGYRYEMSVVDKGELWRPSMRVRLTISSSSGAVVAVVDGTLSSGGCTLTRAFRR